MVQRRTRGFVGRTTPKKSPFGYHFRTLLNFFNTQQTLPSAGSRQKGWVRSHGRRGVLIKMGRKWNQPPAAVGGEMNWWRSLKKYTYFWKISCTTLCTAPRRRTTTQRESSQPATEAQSSFLSIFQSTGSQSRSTQVHDQSRRLPHSSFRGFSSFSSFFSFWYKGKLKKIQKNKYGQSAQYGEKLDQTSKTF
jgi:hypothetical protein